MNGQEDEHSDLIQRAGSDPDAFAELYLRHYGDVFHYCVRRLFDRHLAEDVTSIVFFKVLCSLGSFDGKATGFRSWLLRIATNAVNDHLREARRRSQALQKVARDTRVDGGDAVEADDDRIAKKALLQQALLSLKPKFQTVITLRCFENMRSTEISAALERLSRTPAPTDGPHGPSVENHHENICSKTGRGGGNRGPVVGRHAFDGSFQRSVG